jgi:hypothetical protein
MREEDPRPPLLCGGGRRLLTHPVHRLGHRVRAVSPL